MSQFEYTQVRLDIDPAKARELLEANVNNRPLRKRAVAEYAQAMSRGQWHGIADQAIVLITLPDGQLRLLNGQHRLQAVVQSGITLIQATVRYTTGSEDDAERIYDTFDHASNRTVADIVHSGVPDHARTVGVVARAIAIVEVLKPYGWEAFNTMRVPDRAETYRRHLADSLWAAELRGAVNVGGKRLTAAMLAAAIETHRVAPAESAMFWQQVATGELLAIGDAAYAFREAMLRTHWHGGNASNYASIAVQYRTTLLAWRHFCAGTKVLKLVTQITDTPFQVAIARPTTRGNG